MAEEKTQQTGFRFQKETLEKLQKLAKNDRRSQNTLVEILIDREYECVFGPKQEEANSRVPGVSL
jgi:hypothetical protein